MDGTGDSEAGKVGVNRDRLAEIARAFRDQAKALRRRAERILVGVLGTVVGMTIVVVTLPPIINVAEDWVLARFGYQTSQYDFQRETARQAADVRARSQALLRLLEERNRVIGDVTDVFHRPHTTFMPVYLETPARNDRTIIYDAVETDGFQVMIGAWTDEVTAFRAPLIVYRNGAEAPWREVELFTDSDTGALFDLAPVTGGVIVVGQVNDEGAAILVSPEKNATLLPALGEFTLSLSDVAATEDGTVFAVSGTLSENASSNTAVGGRNSTIRVFDELGSGVWLEVFEEFIQDLHWDGDALVALSREAATLPRGLRVHTFGDGRNTPANDGRPEVIDAPLWPLGIFENPSRGGAASIFAINDREEELLDRTQNQLGLWRVNGAFNGADLEMGTRFGELPFGLIGDFAFYGGAGDGTISVLSEAADEPEVTNIELTANTFDTSFFNVINLGDGRLRLSHGEGVPADAEAPGPLMLYVDAPPPAIDMAITDQAVPSFLAGNLTSESASDAEPIGGDTTAEAAGIVNGRNYLAQSVAPFLEFVEETDMLLVSEAFEAAARLEAFSASWEAEWDERERSATILSRLRTADEAGSLWRNISSLAARLAVIALLIYLVNILVNLYRYNMRLAAFYQARGDAIDTALATGADLSAMAGSSLAELAAAHTPEDVTFGARPAPPTEVILNAIKDVAKTAQR